MLGYTPPPKIRHPPKSRHPQEQTPPGADTPQEQTPPQRADTPKGRHPPQEQTSPLHTVNGQPVCILLECILVSEACVKNSVQRGGSPGPHLGGGLGFSRPTPGGCLQDETGGGVSRPQGVCPSMH